MDSTRQNKISRLIQKELSDILLKLAKETRGIMVSVSIVRVSPDLGVAKAYLSVFPSERGNEVVNHLNENIGKDDTIRFRGACAVGGIGERTGDENVIIFSARDHR